MIKPSEFIERWREIQTKSKPPGDDKLCTASESRLSTCALPADAKRFLAEAGLPDNCSPFLSFTEIKRGLPRLWELFSPGQWEQKQKDRVSRYVLIGDDGDAGNPICLDESSGQVVIIEHETLFAKTSFWSRKKIPSIQPMNQSIQQLAESILCHASFIQQVRALGYTAISDTLPKEPAQWLETELKRIDATVLAEGSFWYCEMADIRRRAKNTA